MKIAIIKLSSIGDISHTAFIPYLVSKYIKNSEIHWFCDELFTDINDGIDCIHKIHPTISKNAKSKPVAFARQFLQLLNIAKKERFDVVIDFQGTFKSALIAKFLCTNQNLWGFLYTRDILAHKVYKKHCNIPLQSNVYQRAISIANEALNLKISHKEIPIPFLQHKHLNQERGIIIFPSSSHECKNYSIQNFQKLITKINNHKITLLFGSSSEELICKEIARDRKDIEIIGGLNLAKVKSVISTSKCVIGGDTGILHIASAMYVKNITLYGPTPSYRTSIHMPHSITLQGNGDVNKIPTKQIIEAINFLKI